MSRFKYAFSLSKNDVKNATPPGTVTLIEHLEWTASQRIHDEIRLIPQPSSDPADPLNFSIWRKAGLLASMSLFAFTANFTSGSISSAFPIYASTPALGLPPKTFSDLTKLSAINILFLGTSNLWWVPLSNVFGRRPVILSSLLLLVLSSMWAGLTHNYGSLLAARAFMGMGAGSADSVSPAVVGETFFVHERGRVMAIYTGLLCAGPFVGPIAGGFIISARGTAWLQWTNVILSAITLVVCFFLQPETLYDRSEVQLSDLDASEKTHSEKADSVAVPGVTSNTTTYRPYTFIRSMKLITYRPGILRQFLAPFIVLRLPGVWLISLWYAGLVGVIVIASTVATQLTSEPPYLWGKNASLVNVGGLIGTAIGLLYCFFVADWTTKRLAKKDIHGFTEPESRLITALPSFVIGVSGTLIFGFVGQYPSPKGWVGLEVGLGMVAFALMQAPSVGFNYIIESYTTVAGDCFVAITSTRATIAFAWTFIVGQWVTSDGTAEPFGIFGMLLGIFGLLTIPFLLWGKRFRIATENWVKRVE